MKNYIRLIVSCILFVAINSSFIACKPRYFTLQHEDKKTGIEDFIKINGFYYIEKSNPYNNSHSDAHIIFYDNGIACFPPFYPTEEECYRTKMTKDKTMWGSYTFDKEKQLIHTETIFRFGINSGTWVVKKTFKIIDSTHIMLISKQTENKKIYEDNIIYEFKEEPNIFDSSTNWLLKKNWFWKKGAKKIRSYRESN